MRLPIDTLRDVYASFRDTYPDEGCGVIDRCGRWVPLVNVATDPRAAFRVAPGLVQAHGAMAVLHSHPGGWRCPSKADMEAQTASGITWGICWLDDRRMEPPFWWSSAPRDPRGQGWRSGVHDCLNLVRWALLDRHGIFVPDVPRSPMAGDELALTIQAQARLLGGEPAVGPIRVGDVVVIGGSAPHLGIVESDGTVWHHPGPAAVDYAPQNLPVRTSMEALLRGRLVHGRWRHRDLATRSAA